MWLVLFKEKFGLSVFLLSNIFTIEFCLIWWKKKLMSINDISGWMIPFHTITFPLISRSVHCPGQAMLRHIQALFYFKNRGLYSTAIILLRTSQAQALPFVNWSRPKTTLLIQAGDLLVFYHLVKALPKY